MFTHEFWLIFSIGAYFVCEVLPIVRDVIYHNMRPERVTDETRMLKEASHDDTSIAHDDISSHPNLLLPVHDCSCSYCAAKRTHRLACECYLCTGKIKRMKDKSTKAIESGDFIEVMVDDQVVATYCGSCGGHRQHTEDCETTYDADDWERSQW
jgi:hypothetical protein